MTDREIAEKLAEALKPIEACADREYHDSNDPHYATAFAGIRATARSALNAYEAHLKAEAIRDGVA